MYVCFYLLLRFSVLDYYLQSIDRTQILKKNILNIIYSKNSSDSETREVCIIKKIKTKK